MLRRFIHFTLKKYGSRVGDWCVSGKGSYVVVLAGGGEEEERPQAELWSGVCVGRQEARPKDKKSH